MKTRKAIATLLIALLTLHQVVLPLPWPQQDRTVIAIVDFENTSENDRLDYLEQTIPEAISTNLARSGRLEIVERSRLEAAMQEMEMGLMGVVDEQTAAELGRAVGATTILVGSFVSISGFVRINARLIDVQTARVLAAENVQGSEAGEGLFNLMDQISAAMESQLLGTSAATATSRPQAAPVAQPQPEEQPPAQQQPQTQVVVVEKKGSGLFWLFALVVVIGGAYYYYTYVLNAPATVDVNVNIQP